jgi:hypothetical protein
MNFIQGWRIEVRLLGVGEKELLVVCRNVKAV